MEWKNVGLVALLVLVIAAPLAAPAGAQSADNSTATNNTTTAAATTATTATTTTTTTTPSGVSEEEARERVAERRSGEYGISMLREGGEVPENTQEEGIRALGDPPMGFASLRYQDPSLWDEIMGNPGTFKYIGADDTVRQNEIQVYGSAFGDVSGEYTLVLVYWQPEEMQVGNRTVTYAANQTVDRHKVGMGGGQLYSVENVSLREHYDSTWRVTGWLVKDGERQDGVQWTFKHRSNPEAQSVNITSAGGAWGFAIRTTLIPGILALVAGLIGARGTLRLTGRGPGYGVGSWLLIVGIVGMVVSLIAYYQIAVILSNLPYVMGLSIGVIAYAAGLTFHQPVKKIGFLRRELAEAVTIPGDNPIRASTDGGAFDGDAGAELFDELSEAILVDLPEVPAVRTDGGYRIPETGLRPFLARLFADAALLDVSNIATRDSVREGRIDEIIQVNPDADRALEHKPARLVRVLPIDTLGEDSNLWQEMWAYALTALIAIGPMAVGYIGFDRIANIPTVGVIAGALVTIVIAYSAEDGWIDFEAAEPHYKKAEDSLTFLQRAHKEARDDQSAREELYNERGKSVKEAKQEMDRESGVVTDKILEALGAKPSDDDDGDGEDEHKSLEDAGFKPADDGGEDDGGGQ